MTPQELLNTSKVAEILEVDRSTISRMVERGDLTPLAKFGGSTGAYVFARSDIEAFDAKRREGASA